MVEYLRSITVLYLSSQHLTSYILLPTPARAPSQNEVSWLVAAGGSWAGRQLWWLQLYYSLYCRAVIRRRSRSARLQGKCHVYCHSHTHPNLMSSMELILAASICLFLHRTPSVLTPSFLHTVVSLIVFTHFALCSSLHPSFKPIHLPSSAFIKLMLSVAALPTMWPHCWGAGGQWPGMASEAKVRAVTLPWHIYSLTHTHKQADGGPHKGMHTHTTATYGRVYSIY